jgi:hypothetical protein
VRVGVPFYYDHGLDFGVVRYDGAGQADYASIASGFLEGHEVALGGDGGFFLASFYPTGPSGPYQPSAGLTLRPTPKWSEWQEESFYQFYSDIGLAATEDGGVVLFWSQVRERIGLFARRFNAAGEVTSVGAGSLTAPGLSRLRFVPGVGVRAAVALAGPARFELFDLAGRRIASHALGAGTREITLAGTSALPSGLYFGRLVAGADAIAGKVIVAR